MTNSAPRLPFRSVLVGAALALVASFALGCSKAEANGPVPGADGKPELRIQVNAEGYQPSEATAPAGKPVRVVFTRVSEEGCGEKVVFPELKLEKELPLNKPVPVELTMPANGKLAFTCGMDMYKGAIVAR